MKKLTIGFCAAMILLTGAVITACRNEEEGFGGSTSTEVADRIASLESQVASLQQSISSLKAASEASESTLREELEAQKTALETAKAELQKEIDAMTGVDDFSGLIERLEALESEVPANYSDLSGKITSLVETLGGKSDTVQVQAMLDELKAGIEKLAIEDEAIAEQLADLSAQIAQLTESLNGKLDESQVQELLATLKTELEQLINENKTTLTGEITKLTGKIDQLSDKLDGKSDTVQVQVKLDELKAQFEGAIAVADGKIAACDTAVAKLDTTCAAMQKQLIDMQAALGSKVDTTKYNAFVRETNKKIQDNAETLSTLQALCDGFEGDATIQEYIDSAIVNVKSQLGSYVLQETYETFVEEYGTFETEIKAKLLENEQEITALKNTIDDLSPDVNMGDLVGLEERIVLLNSRVDSLKNNALTLEKIQEQFNKSNTAFLSGVNGIIDDALGEGGAITVAIAASAEELSTEYQKQIKTLSERIDALERRVDNLDDKVSDLDDKVSDLESKFDALLNSIQSLVYVPKTADGKIHIGTSYVAEIGADSTESRTRIEVASTKKLEYRVSPANLRDAMILLYEAKPDAFSFWQEHVSRVHEAEVKAEGTLRTYAANAVTRAGEPREGHDGLHEFNIVKLERGNSEGTLLITVDNEHDFTHEDLAVSLCIRYQDTTGVLTEYSSAYTPVVGEGSNLIGRFYLAKKDENGNYTKVSRTDRIDYTLVYTDRTPIKLMEGYEVVYDNGETVMSLEDAKAKYEWDAELTGSVFRTNGITGTEGTLRSDCYTITTINDRQTFALTDKCSEDNLGASWYSKSYGAKVSDKEGKSVTIVSEVQVYVTVVPETYKVSAAVTWNLGNFYYGLTNNWQAETSIYTTPAAQLTYSKKGEDTPAGNLPSSVYKSLFADGHTWTLTDPCDSLKTNGSLTVTSKVVGTDLAFSVKGFVWCEDTHHIAMSRTGNNTIPTSGAKSITVTGTLDFVGPSADDLKVSIGDEENPILMPTKADSSIYKSKGNGTSFALLYLAAETSYSFIPKEKVLPLNKKFFSSDVIFYTDYTQIDLANVKCQKQEGSGDGSPETLKLEYYTKTGSRPMPVLRSINVKNNEAGSKISEITQETTYKTDKPFNIVLGKDAEIAPTITVESITFKVVPATAE